MIVVIMVMFVKLMTVKVMNDKNYYVGGGEVDDSEDNDDDNGGNDDKGDSDAGDLNPRKILGIRWIILRERYVCRQHLSFHKKMLTQISYALKLHTHIQARITINKH